MSDDHYVIPGTTVLRNKLGITDAAELDRAERLLVVQRTVEGIPTGNSDLSHLRAIHRHLFQDVYEWAGEVRTLEISKGGSQFQFARFIEAGMDDVHRRLVQKRFLTGLSADAFADYAGQIIGDVNYVHPFREGNGRTQLEYLRQLGERAGHGLNPDRLDPDTWQSASRDAHLGDYSTMAHAIRTQAMNVSNDEEELRQRQLAAWLAADRGQGR